MKVYRVHPKGWMKNRIGYWSDTFSLKYDKIFEYRRDNNIGKDVVVEIYDPIDGIWCDIEICYWLYKIPLNVVKNYIQESRCKNTLKIRRVIEKFSHTSYHGKGILALAGIGMRKSILIWGYKVENIKCPGCKDCKGSFNKFKRNVKKWLRKDTAATLALVAEMRRK